MFCLLQDGTSGTVIVVRAEGLVAAAGRTGTTAGPVGEAAARGGPGDQAVPAREAVVDPWTAAASS